MSTNHEDVGEFHRKFGLRHGNDGDTGARPVDRELLLFRLNFLLEELTELVVSCGGHFEPQYEPADDGDAMMVGMVVRLPEELDIKHAEAFDALIDLNYVSHGTAHLLGYPWQIGWNAVQRANMTKERATPETASARGGQWDVVKPPGWTPPPIEKILADHGFRKPPVACPVCGAVYNDESTQCEPGICRKGGIG